MTKKECSAKANEKEICMNQKQNVSQFSALLGSVGLEDIIGRILGRAGLEDIIGRILGRAGLEDVIATGTIKGKSSRTDRREDQGRSNMQRSRKRQKKRSV